MKNDRFLKRLKKEMPLWVERGWVREEGREAILDHVTSQGEGGARHLTMACSTTKPLFCLYLAIHNSLKEAL